MAASQLQLLAWNLRMRGQGQQRARGEIVVYSTFPPPPPPPRLLPSPLCAHSHQRGPRYVALIPLLLYASLPLPYPSKTNLIPSRAGRETESWTRWGGGRHKAEKWAGTSTAGSSSEAIRRGTGTFSSSKPGSHRLGFCHFTTSHTHTHARLWHVFSTIQKFLSYYAERSSCT